MMPHSEKISRIQKKGGTVALALAAGVLMAAGVATSPAWASPPSGHSEPQKTTFCHATGSQTNPYVGITSADESIFEAHSEHQDTGDIIPPFTFTDVKGNTVSFAGLNWDASGQAILANGCALPGPSPTPAPTQTETVTPTPTPTETKTVTPIPTPTETKMVTPSTAPVLPGTGGSTSSAPSGAAAAGTVVQSGVGQAGVGEAGVGQAGVGQAGVGQAGAAGAVGGGEVSMSAQTAAGAQPADYTLSDSLLGSGLLLSLWLGLSRLAHRRGRHA